MITITLPNSDGPAIPITGALRFSGSATAADGKRHLHLAIYEQREIGYEESGRKRNAHEDRWFAWSITYNSSWPHEVPHYLSSLTAQEELRKDLVAVDPSRWVKGIPNITNDQQYTRQELLLRDVRERWQALVTAAMEHVKT